MTAEEAKKGVELVKQIDKLRDDIKDLHAIEAEQFKIEFCTSEGWIGVYVSDKETTELFANLLALRLTDKLKKTSKELEKL